MREILQNKAVTLWFCFGQSSLPLELWIAPIIATLILSGTIPLLYYRERLVAPDQIMTSSSIATLSLSRSIASYHAQLLRWLRRRSERCQSSATKWRNAWSARLFVGTAW